MSDDPLSECPECGAKAQRQISGGAGFLFKGDGFYKNDHGSGAKGRKADAGSTVKSDSGSTDTGSTRDSNSDSSGSSKGSDSSGDSGGSSSSSSGSSSSGDKATASAA